MPFWLVILILAVEIPVTLWISRRWVEPAGRRAGDKFARWIIRKVEGR